MKRTFIQKAFAQWLEKNEAAFIYPPCHFHYRHGGVHFNLQGIIPDLQWFVHKGGSCVIAHDDFLVDCDILERKTVNGLYYCDWRALLHDNMAVGYQTPLYKTRYELYENESFNCLLEFSNQKVHADRWLCYYDDDRGVAAMIVTTEQLNDPSNQRYWFYSSNRVKLGL